MMQTINEPYNKEINIKYMIVQNVKSTHREQICFMICLSGWSFLDQVPTLKESKIWK